ncbi:hypothetical protein BDDG_12925, partial [Blastomyces dermatitidis ATCC 18188]
MTLCSHNKHHCSAYTEQFISKSSYVDRFAFTDDSELSIESLIENLKNVIMKKLSVLYIIRSSMSLSALSVSFSVTFPQSSTSASVPGFSLTTSVLTILTSATSGFTVSAFVISSPHFKKMLYRLNKLYLSRITSSLNSVEI